MIDLLNALRPAHAGPRPRHAIHRGRGTRAVAAIIRGRRVLVSALLSLCAAGATLLCLAASLAATLTSVLPATIALSTVA